MRQRKKEEAGGSGISAPAPRRPLELDPPPLCQPGPGWAWRGGRYVVTRVHPVPSACGGSRELPLQEGWGTAQQGRETCLG